MSVTRERIDRCEPFSALSEPARETLAGIGRGVAWEEGERLVPLGRTPERLSVLTAGLAKRVGYSSRGCERVVALYRPDDLVGTEILLEEPTGGDEIVALTPIDAIAFAGRDLVAAVSRHPEILRAVAREVSRHLEEMVERIVRATAADVSERLAKLLLEFSAPEPGDDGYATLTYPLTHELMSQIVGASRPHTSTVLRALEASGALLRQSPRGLVVRPERLRAIAEGEATPARAA